MDNERTIAHLDRFYITTIHPSSTNNPCKIISYSIKGNDGVHTIYLYYYLFNLTYINNTSIFGR
jgi:hypothetical protein